MRSEVWRPAAAARNRAPGGPGHRPPGTIRPGCEELAARAAEEMLQTEARPPAENRHGGANSAYTGEHTRTTVNNIKLRKYHSTSVCYCFGLHATDQHCSGTFPGYCRRPPSAEAAARHIARIRNRAPALVAAPQALLHIGLAERVAWLSAQAERPRQLERPMHRERRRLDQEDRLRGRPRGVRRQACLRLLGSDPAGAPDRAPTARRQ